MGGGAGDATFEPILLTIGGVWEGASPPEIWPPFAFKVDDDDDEEEEEDEEDDEDEEEDVEPLEGDGGGNIWDWW